MLKPIRTEKSLQQAVLNKYTFVGPVSLRKPDIKAEVEKTYGVVVTKVQTAIMPGKTYRAGRKGGIAHRSDFKKAIVTVKSDQKIDLYA